MQKNETQRVPGQPGTLCVETLSQLLHPQSSYYKKDERAVLERTQRRGNLCTPGIQIRTPIRKTQYGNVFEK
jgi:hypothetical protein